MKTLTLWLSGSFAAAILLVAVAAGWRAAPDSGKAVDAGAWNGAATREFETHYDAVFPVRTLGINVWAAISYGLFREGKPGVVVGRDDWLYTSEEFALASDADAQVEAHLAQVVQVRERLAAQGAALLVALVPAKTRVYPEQLTREPAALHRDLYGRVLDGLAARDVAAPDLLPAMLSCKAAGPAFLRTDTHWTPLGARCAAERLANVAAAADLRSETPALYVTRVEKTEPHPGDLLKFLPLDPWFAALLPAPDRIDVRRTEPVGLPAGGDALLDDAPRPEVVLVGTSYSANPRWNFTGALQESFGEDVANYAAEARGPFLPMLEYLDSEDFRTAPPRLVIWEMPERYFPMADEGPGSSNTEGKTS